MVAIEGEAVKTGRWLVLLSMLVYGCAPKAPHNAPQATSAPPAAVATPVPVPVAAPAPALDITALRQVLRWALIMEAAVPAGSTVTLVTHDALATGSSGPALVCATRAGSADVRVLQMLPATRADGMRELQAYRDWLEQQGLTAIIVEHQGVVTLVYDGSGGSKLVMQVNDAGARVVQGARDTAAARALLTQLFPE